MDAGELWSGFPLDPREGTHAALLAADSDRERIRSVLVDGYAEGRLTRDEYDARATALDASRTLGELPVLVHDLVAPGSGALAARSSSAVAQTRAAQHWQTQRRAAVLGFLGPTLVSWVVWGAFGLGGFPWPLVVMLVLGVHLARVLGRRDQVVARERRRIDKKQARSVEGDTET